MHQDRSVGRLSATKSGIILLAAIALTGCGSDREAELARQLAEAEMAAAEANAAKLPAQRDAQATRARVKEESYAAFYGQEDADESADTAATDADTAAADADSAAADVDNAVADGDAPVESMPDLQDAISDLQ